MMFHLLVPLVVQAKPLYVPRVNLQFGGVARALARPHSILFVHATEIAACPKGTDIYIAADDMLETESRQRKTSLPLTQMGLLPSPPRHRQRLCKELAAEIVAAEAAEAAEDRGLVVANFSQVMLASSLLLLLPLLVQR